MSKSYKRRKQFKKLRKALIKKHGRNLGEFMFAAKLEENQLEQNIPQGIESIGEVEIVCDKSYKAPVYNTEQENWFSGCGY